MTCRTSLLVLVLVRHMRSVLLDRNGISLIPETRDVCPSMNITLTCSSKRHNISELSFEVTNEIRMTNPYVVNDSAIGTQLYDFPEKLIYTRVKCQATNGDSDPRNLYFVDDPVPVSNLSCIVYDRTGSMNCTWYIPASDTSAHIVKWRDPHTSCYWKSCPAGSDTHCYWEPTLSVSFSRRPVDILVTSRADCGLQATKCFSIDTDDFVKPAPVFDLQSRTLNSTCIEVTWKTKTTGYKKKYKIWYTSKWETTMLQSPFLQNEYDKVCNLTPATRYTFQVAVMPVRSRWSGDGVDNNMMRNYCNITETLPEGCHYVNGSGYYSEPRETVSATYSDVPSTSPNVTDGGWSWNPEECDSEDRQVTVYWQPLNDKDKNGDLKGYVVNVSSPIRSSIFSVAPEINQITQTLPCSASYSVIIQAENINGTSPNPSSVSVLDQRKGIFPPKFMVEISNYTDKDGNRTVFVEWEPVLVHWEPGIKGDITSFSIFWCKKEQGECVATKHIKWKEVEKTYQKTELQLQSPEDYLFGVSMETSNGSSGITWGKCIYTKDVEPKRSPANVEVYAGMKNKALYVTWEKPLCLSGEPFISNYTVKYCSRNTCNTQQTTDNKIVLGNLDDSQEYKVRVRGVTRTGAKGPWSEHVQEVPIDKNWKSGEIVALSIGCVVAFVILVAAGVNVVRCMYPRIRDKFTPPPIADLIPDNIGESGSKETKLNLLMDSEVSNESGYVDDREDFEESLIAYKTVSFDDNSAMGKCERKNHGRNSRLDYLHRDYVQTIHLSTLQPMFNSDSENQHYIGSKSWESNLTEEQAVEEDLESLSDSAYICSEDDTREKNDKMRFAGLTDENVSGYITEDMAEKIDGSNRLMVEEEMLTNTDHGQLCNEECQPMKDLYSQSADLDQMNGTDLESIKPAEDDTSIVYSTMLTTTLETNKHYTNHLLEIVNSTKNTKEKASKSNGTNESTAYINIETNKNTKYRSNETTENPENRGNGTNENAEIRGNGTNENAEYSGNGTNGNVEYSGNGTNGNVEYSGNGTNGNVEIRGNGTNENAEIRGNGTNENAEYSGNGTNGNVEYRDNGTNGNVEYRDNGTNGNVEYRDNGTNENVEYRDSGTNGNVEYRDNGTNGNGTCIENVSYENAAYRCNGNTERIADRSIGTKERVVDRYKGTNASIAFKNKSNLSDSSDDKDITPNHCAISIDHLAPGSCTSADGTLQMNHSTDRQLEQLENSYVAENLVDAITNANSGKSIELDQMKNCVCSLVQKDQSCPADICRTTEDTTEMLNGNLVSEDGYITEDFAKFMAS